MKKIFIIILSLVYFASAAEPFYMWGDDGAGNPTDTLFLDEQGFRYQRQGETLFEVDTASRVKLDVLQIRSRKPQALISFIFDDGNNTDYTVMRPIFKAQGVVANFAITGTRGGAKLTWAQIDSLVADGDEILNHSFSHAHLCSISLDSVRTEWELLNDSCAAHGITLLNAVYPYNEHNDSVRRVAKEYFRSARAGGYGWNPSVLETYALAAQNIDNSDSLAKYKAWVDTCEMRKTWLIFYAHATDSDDADSINALINYIKLKNIPIATVDQALDSIGNTIEAGDGIALGEGGIRFFPPEESVYRIGRYAGYSNTSGTRNIFFGHKAGMYNTSGYGNVVIGDNAFKDNTTGYANIAIGYMANYSGNGNSNVAIGYAALGGNQTGWSNVGIGYDALRTVGAGYDNVGVGYNALRNIGDGHRNIAVGLRAGYNYTGNFSVFIGHRAGQDAVGDYRLYVDSDSTDYPLIYGEFDNKLVKIHDELRVCDTTGTDSTIIRSTAVVAESLFGKIDTTEIDFTTYVANHGGEANTASNQGVGGIGLWWQKSGVDLQFKNINAGTNQISVSDDAVNHEVDIDVVEANIKLDDLGTPDDNTDLNATMTYHGLLPKLGGGTTNYLRADGTWAAPPGGPMTHQELEDSLNVSIVEITENWYFKSDTIFFVNATNDTQPITINANGELVIGYPDTTKIDSVQIGGGEVWIKTVKIGSHLAVILSGNDTLWCADDTTGF